LLRRFTLRKTNHSFQEYKFIIFKCRKIVRDIAFLNKLTRNKNTPVYVVYNTVSVENEIFWSFIICLEMLVGQDFKRGSNFK